MAKLCLNICQESPSVGRERPAARTTCGSAWRNRGVVEDVADDDDDIGED